jgi:hypothetical protein
MTLPSPRKYTVLKYQGTAKPNAASAHKKTRKRRVEERCGIGLIGLLQQTPMKLLKHRLNPPAPHQG